MCFAHRAIPPRPEGRGFPRNRMNSKISRRTAPLTRIATAILVAGALHASAASAVNFQYRQFIPGLMSGATGQAPDVVTEILMALTGGPALPAGEVNFPYNYDLNQLLSVTGDKAYSAANVAWSLSAGALPAGLSLGSDGVISGTPTTKDTVGSSFQVLSTYKTKTGQQAYTIVVNGAVLHVTQISAGSYHTCAITTAGGVKCWGGDDYGQLGNDSSLASKPTPVDVLGLTSGVARISAGGSHTCAVTTTGGAKCWGLDTYGQLGNDASAASQATPVDVLGLTSGIASISAGGNHTCAVTTTGGAKCWGRGDGGQLGNDVAVANKATPVDVLGLTSGVANISTGDSHSCAVTTTGGAKCWGQDNSGQLGNDAALVSQAVPVDVQGLTAGVASISAGGYHTCVVTTAGGAKCWGYDGMGNLGNDTALSDKGTPVDVLGLSAGVASISAGGYHTCAVTSAGGAKCWGYAGSAQLGNDTPFVNKATPVDVQGLTYGTANISAGFRHTCAVTTSGGAKCWGYDSSGQLGNDATKADQPTPVDVAP